MQLGHSACVGRMWHPACVAEVAGWPPPAAGGGAVAVAASRFTSNRVYCCLSPRTCAVTAPRGPRASLVCRVSKGTKVSWDGQGEMAQKGRR